MFQKRKTLFMIIVLALTLCGISGRVKAADKKEREVIRVAYPVQQGLTEVDEDGHYSGYTYEYLEEIAQYTGWRYEFVQVPGEINESLSTLMQMVEDGELDLMGGMLYDESLAEKFAYAGYSYGSVNTTLEVLFQNATDHAINSQRMQHMRIAIPEKAQIRLRELMEYCKMNLITPELIYCATDEEQKQALIDGRADAMLNTSANYVEGVRTIARFAPKPFYFISGKQNEALLEKLNEAILNIDTVDPYFSTRLYEKYFNSGNIFLNLNEEEKAFVSETGPVRVGLLRELPPFQYEDKKSGQMRGISLDLMNYIAEQTGLTFKPVWVDTTEELLALQEEGAVDMLGGLTYDYELARNFDVALTRPFAVTQYVMVLNKKVQADSVAGRKLAMPKSTTYHGYFIGDVNWYDSAAECVKLVNEGKADYTYVNGYIAQFYVNQPDYNHIYLVPQTYTPCKVCFGVSHSDDLRLLEIMNKTLNSISEEKIENIVYRNTVYRSSLTFAGVIRNYPVQTILIVTGVLLCVIGVMSWGLITKARMNRKISLDLEKHLKVYEMSSESFFEYDYASREFIITRGEEILNGAAADGDAADNEVRGEEEKKRREILLNLIHTHTDGVEDVLFPFEGGESYWYRISMKTLFGKEGKPAYTIGKAINVDEEKREKDKLLEQAQKDSLTHLYNADTVRRLIEERLEEMKEGDRGALMLLDVDHFKAVNDTYGHMKGDEVLSKVAEILRSSFRKEDIVGRPGGDEFLVYVKDAGAHGSLEKRAERLCAQLRQVSTEGEEHITGSLGIAYSTKGAGYEELFRKADKALYQAKEAGRDCYAAFSEENSKKG